MLKKYHDESENQLYKFSVTCNCVPIPVIFPQLSLILNVHARTGGCPRAPP